MNSVIKIYVAIILAVLCSVGIELRGQDPIFSQYYMNSLLSNPAFSGVNPGGNMAVSYRNQWLGYDQGYNTMAVAYDQGLYRNSSLGGWMLADRVGDGLLSTVVMKGIGATQVSLNRHTFLKGGVELGIGYMQLNWDKLVFGDAIDARFGHVTPGGSRLPTAEVRPDRSSNIYIDMGVGFLLYNKRYYGGFSLKHINRPVVSFYDKGERKPIQVNLQGGMHIPLSSLSSDRMFLSPNMLFSYTAGSYQLTLGSLYTFRSFFTGAWIRAARKNIDAVIASAGVRYDNWRISYSYDLTLSKLTPSTYGSHELGFTIIFEDTSKRNSNFSDCFEIFR